MTEPRPNESDNETPEPEGSRRDELVEVRSGIGLQDRALCLDITDDQGRRVLAVDLSPEDAWAVVQGGAVRVQARIYRPRVNVEEFRRLRAIEAAARAMIADAGTLDSGPWDRLREALETDR